MFDRLRAALRPAKTKAFEAAVAKTQAHNAKMAATSFEETPPDNGVHYFIDQSTGQTYGEEHYKDRKPHRDGDLPAVDIYHQDRQQKEWCTNGLHDRVGAPAIEITGWNGYEARYLRNGRQHNPDGPAVVIDGPDGLVREWWKDGTLQSRFEEFHGVEPDYEAPGGERGGNAYRQQVFDPQGNAIFTAASSTDPFSWGERNERFERRPTTHERLTVEARLNEQRAYFDKIGGMSPWDNKPRTMGNFLDNEPQEAATPRPGGVKAAAAAAAAKAAEAKTAKPKTADRGDER